MGHWIQTETRTADGHLIALNACRQATEPDKGPQAIHNLGANNAIEQMKLVVSLLFTLTSITIFWQCGDMIPTLQASGAGPAVMVLLWLPAGGLLIVGLLASVNLRASCIAGGVCLLPLMTFYALTLFSMDHFSFARDWSYLLPLSGMVASTVLIVRQVTKRKVYVREK